MKFARDFREALERDGFPPHWVESAIPYGQLKKCIKKVERELESFGLDSRILGLLMSPSPHQDKTGNDDQPVGFRYELAGERYQVVLNIANNYCCGDDLNVFRPTLTLYIQR